MVERASSATVHGGTPVPVEIFSARAVRAGQPQAVVSQQLTTNCGALQTACVPGISIRYTHMSGFVAPLQPPVMQDVLSPPLSVSYARLNGPTCCHSRQRRLTPREITVGSTPEPPTPGFWERKRNALARRLLPAGVLGRSVALRGCEGSADFAEKQGEPAD